MELLIFLLLALSTYSLDVYKKYYFINVPKIWTEAQSYCRETFDDLVTVVSTDEWEKMRYLASNEGQSRIWIGLYDDVNSWRWSLDNTFLYSDGNTNLESWFDFIPDNYGSRQHCGYMENGTIYDGECTNLIRSACYDEPSNTYIAVTTLRTWQDAQSYCRQTYTDLASIRNQAEMETIKSLTLEPNQWWLGLFRDSWKWSDQSTSSFTLWWPGEPHGGIQHCAFATTDSWGDVPCTDTYPFVCSGTPKRANVFKVFLKTDGSLDLSDAEEQKAVQTQIEKHLRQQVVQQEFNLTWRNQPYGNVFDLL